jgi:hypothetical protein
VKEMRFWRQDGRGAGMFNLRESLKTTELGAPRFPGESEAFKAYIIAIMFKEGQTKRGEEIQRRE